VVVPSVVTFLITRFGYQKKYRSEVEKSQHEANMSRISTDKLAYDVYNDIIQSFRSQIEIITEQKNSLVQQVKRLRDSVKECNDKLLE
jgi:Mg2+ and Co2+ transporter CorA